ncbi:MAG: hypothetical protein M1834_009717 [Cirrosporium novae-zelandiae]|nr:MAG: hypothetical protein M1834_009717 [Cirrosporium novae-zelandiae]
MTPRPFLSVFHFLAISSSILSLLIPSSTTASNSSPGCDTTSTPSFPIGTSKNFTLKTSDGRTRDYLLYLPENYTPTTPSPLIFSYHGNGKNMTNQESLSQLSNSTFNKDYLVVYPQGVKNHWEGPTYAVKGVSDVNFTAELLEELEAGYCVDVDRVYANGKSNGGGFVDTLACSGERAGEAFAAFAPVSGAFYTDLNASSPCDLGSRVRTPMLEFHGTGDKVINYTGGEGGGGPIPPIPEWLARWGARNGCEDSSCYSETEEYGGVVQYITYSGNGVDEVVEHYRIDGMGHDWPSTMWNSDNEGDVTVLDATPLILEFFERWVKE